MAYVLTLEGFTPGARYDANPWTQARIEEAVAQAGPWTPLATFNLVPLDADPEHPQERSFTTSSPNPRGWYRIVWIDAAANEQDTPAIYSDQSLFEQVGVPFRDLVARLRALSAMTETEAKARINQAHRRWVADCEANKVKVEIGPTAIGQFSYPLEARIVSLHRVRVDGKSYALKTIDEIEDLQNGDAFAVDYPARFFTQDFTEGGVSELMIYPTPEQAGLPITGRASVLPADLSADTDYPSLPGDFHEDLITDAFATTLERDDEQIDAAVTLKAQVEGRKKELRARLTHSVGRGPLRIRLTR